MTTTTSTVDRAGWWTPTGWPSTFLMPQVQVVEVDVSPSAYQVGHIDGAVLWNIYTDLKDPNYQLVDAPALEALLARSGITADSTVVFYGYGPALGFWLMKLYGHRDVRILDCSREAWLCGRPSLEHGRLPLRRNGRYQLGDQDARLRADHDMVGAAITDPNVTLVDVRSAAEYAGERFWPSGGVEPGGRAGHIPTAIHRPLDGLYDARGRCARPPSFGRSSPRRTSTGTRS